VSGSPTIDVSIDDVMMRVPFGSRATNFYIYRDPAIPGDPDLVAAHNIIQNVKHAHTRGTIITSMTVRCDVDGCDRGPMGGNL
jgi:hypothetical protein